MAADRWVGWRVGAEAALLLALFFGTYHRAIAWWWYEWTANGSYYAHGIFVPFFVAAMLWRDRRRIAACPLSTWWAGLAPMAVGFALATYSYRADITVVQSISVMFTLSGVVMLVAGRRVGREMLIPLLFLLTIIPIFPNQIIDRLAFPVQLLSAKLATGMLIAIGLHAVRTGTAIAMDSYTLQVEVACSGFKTLLGLLAFSGAFAYLVEADRWKRWLLFACAAPLSILINGLRIALIALVGELFSTSAAHTFHDYSGVIVLIIGFLALYGVAYAVRCSSFLGYPIAGAPAAMAVPDAATPRVQAPDPGPNAARIARLAQVGRGMTPAIIVMGAMCLAVQFVRPPSAPRGATLAASEVPRSLADRAWLQLGPDLPMTPEVKATLEPEVFVERTYLENRADGRAVELLITGGRSRRTFHDPHDCFVGGGYGIRDLDVVRIPVADGEVVFQEAIATRPRDGAAQRIFFAYVMDGRVLQSMERVHLGIMLRTLFGSDGRPFYFVRVRQMGDGLGEDHRSAMIRFVQAIWSSIGRRMLGPSQRGG